MVKEIDEDLYLSMLYDAYKELLTSNMQEIFELHHYSDLSYREIGALKNITYQAVSDNLRKTTKTLKKYENTLHCVEIKNKIKEISTLVNNSNVDIDVLKDKVKEIGEIYV